MMGAIIDTLIICALFAAGCAGGPLGQPLDTNTNYRMEIHMRVQPDKSAIIQDSIGTLVVPVGGIYHVWAETKDKPDLVALNTCHRDITMPAGYDKLAYDYAPTPLENGDSCAFHIATYSQKVWYRGGLIDFENPALYPVKASLTCNGSVVLANGVAICQGKSGFLQQIVFEKPMNIGLAKGACQVMVPSADYKTWTFPVVSGECLYKFGEKGVPLNLFKLTTYGYDQYLVPQK